MDFVVRKATLDDKPAITILIAESVCGLSRDDYNDEQIESAIKTAVFGMNVNPGCPASRMNTIACLEQITENDRNVTFSGKASRK